MMPESRHPQGDEFQRSAVLLSNEKFCHSAFSDTDPSLYEVKHKSADILARQARPWDERQTGKLLAPLWKVANDLIVSRFQELKGVSPASVVDRKNARSASHHGESRPRFLGARESRAPRRLGR